MPALSGVVPMLVTPFLPDGSLDQPALRRQVAHVLDAGVQGLAVLGLAGEGTYLSLDERELVTQVVLETAAGTPVLVGCSADSTADAIRLAAHAGRLGATAVMVAPPAIPGQSFEDFQAHYAALAHAAPCAVMVQDAPSFLGVEVGVDGVLALAAELANVVAFKIEALPFWEHAARVRHVVGDRLAIFGGHAGLYLLDVLDIGATGLIPGPDLVEPIQRAWAAYQSGDREAAEAIYRRILPFVVFEAQSLGLLIGGAKTLLCERGILSSARARHPRASLDSATRARLLDLAQRSAVA
jgi:4-hydroxy-tetrahydrodipicolinate synthase